MAQNKSMDAHHNRSLDMTSSDVGYPISSFSPLFVAIYGVQSLTGFVGNLIAISVLLKLLKSSSTPTIYCMLNLGVADWVFSTLVVPVIAQMICYPDMLLWQLIDSKILCKVFLMYQMTVVFVSIFTMVLMTVERYLAVVYPIESMAYRTSRNTLLALIVIWIVSLTFSLPQIYMGTIDSSQNTCYIEWKAMEQLLNIPSYKILRVFAGFTTIVTYLFPLSVIVVIYYRIVVVLRQREVARFGDPHKHTDHPNNKNDETNGTAAESGDKKLHNTLHDEHQNLQALAVRRRNERATKLVMIVVVLFAICLLPLQIQYHIWGFDNKATLYEKSPFVSELFMRIVYMFFFLNSIVNPFVYTFQFQPFKEELREFHPIKSLSALFRNCFPQQRQNNAQTDTNGDPRNEHAANDCEV